jgi:hypothetical protein
VVGAGLGYSIRGAKLYLPPIRTMRDLYFYRRQVRAALRQFRGALSLLRPGAASFVSGRYCVTDGCDPVFFSSRAAAMAWADSLSDDQWAQQCKIHVIDGSAPSGCGLIREMETGSPTWYRFDDRVGEWVLNLSDPDVADWCCRMDE